MNETQTTAYALNELAGREREIFESELAADQRLQEELQSASRVADALAQVMTEPAEGLDPRARENLLRAIAENQKSFHQRRKIIRFAVPVSLSAAASIAVLLWVTGGKTPQTPAVAAASVTGAGDHPDIAASQGITIPMSADAKTAKLMHAIGMPTPGQPEVRQRSLLTSENIPLWGAGFQGGAAGSEPLSP